MPGFFDWVSSGISTAVQPIKNWVYDGRDPNLTRPRVTSVDPTQKIDQPQQSLEAMQFPHDLPKYYISLGFEDYNRPSQFQGLVSKGISDYIYLPLPNNMLDNNTINYMEQKGSIIVEGLSQSEQDTYQTGGVDAIKNGGKNVLTNGSPVSGWGVKKIVDGLKPAESLIGEKGLTDASLQVAGLADNPFMTIALKGPAFKTHEFSWRLAPKSAAEAQTIMKIRDTLKQKAYPELLNQQSGGFFKYPSIVWVKFQPDSVMDTAYKFKPCVITNVNFNNTPNDRPGFYETVESPIEVVLELRLQEIELWRGGKGEGGFGGTVNGDFSNKPIRNLGPL